MLASKRKIDLLCFPECALTGYIVDHNKININDIIKGFSKIQGASDKSIYNLFGIILY
jgi:predicted amidohydrolase